MPVVQVITEYVPTEWFDNTAPAINAANLNHIEQGIKNVTEELMLALDRIENLENAPVKDHTHVIADITSLQTELNRCPKGTWSRSGTTLSIDIEGS